MRHSDRRERYRRKNIVKKIGARQKRGREKGGGGGAEHRETYKHAG